MTTQDTKADTWFSPPNPSFPYGQIYRPLDPQRQEIRLVSLLAGRDVEPIHCEICAPASLIQDERESQPCFEAVSYCAGDPKDNVPILLSGYRFHVFRSLFTALKRFRLHDCNRTIWIDQVCINQTDLSERDAQVLLMKKIYELADSTLIWLGEASPQVNTGFTLIEEFLAANRHSLRNRILQFTDYDNEYLQSDRKRLRLFPDDVADYLESERLWNNATDPVLLEHVDRIIEDQALIHASRWLLTKLQAEDESWNGVLELLGLRYWTRCWIYQEVIVSAHPFVVCGPRSVLWEDFVLLLRVFLSAAVLNMLDQTTSETKASDLSTRVLIQDFFSCYGCEEIIPCINIANARRESKPYTLLKHLSATRTSLASDPRDKVFSLLALADSNVTYGVIPNYSLVNKKEDAFIAAAKAVILHQRSWDVLAEVSGAEIETGMPSWAPDWLLQERGTDLSPEYIGYRAGGSHMITPEFLDNDRVLRAPAVVLGSIEILGECDQDEDGTTVVESWTELFLKVHQMPQQAQCTAYLRTLEMNIKPPRPLPDETDAQEEFMEAWSSTLSEFAASQPSARGSHGRRFFMITNPSYNWLGMAPAQAQRNDLVCIFEGSQAPMIIRSGPQDDKEYGSLHQYVGECYVHGAMYGEMFLNHDRDDVQTSMICLA